MQAIILAGGKGTRLRAAVPDLPKPMAPIGDKPFLAYLLHYLQTQGIKQVVLSIGYLHEKISDYFQHAYQGMSIQYVHETEALGTGGAILHAFNHMNTQEPVFILNGDTFVKMDYRAMHAHHVAQQAQFTMALRQVDDAGRYGKVVVQQERVISFREKGEADAGYINAGIYLCAPNYFENHTLPRIFSLEQDFLFPLVAQLKPAAFIAHDYFIDIGIPDDYERAKAELPLL